MCRRTEVRSQTKTLRKAGGGREGEKPREGTGPCKQEVEGGCLCIVDTPKRDGGGCCLPACLPGKGFSGHACGDDLSLVMESRRRDETTDTF